MDLNKIRQLTNQARQDAEERSRKIEEDRAASEPARRADAARAEAEALKDALADLEARMEALARVGKRSCNALVGVLLPTARYRTKRSTGEVESSLCGEVYELKRVLLIHL